MQRGIKKMIIIKTDSEEEMFHVRDNIHKQLVGNIDYVTGDIILNGSDDRNDGTTNEVHVSFTNRCCRPIPTLAI